MRILKHLGRLLVLWLVLGMCYCTVELLWRGVTYFPMLIVGGLCGLLVGLISRHPLFIDRRTWQQCLFGTIITLMVEFASGYVLNVQLGLHIWDYTGMPFNLMGQICLPYAALWFLLMPFAIWLDDWLRWRLFCEVYPRGGPLKNYIALFTGK